MPPPAMGMVGRAAERDRLIDALHAAATGEAATVIISGEAGIGKSRLVDEITDTATTLGFTTVTGNCSPVSGTRIPYGPVVDLLADLLRRYPDVPGTLPAEVWRSIGWLSHTGTGGSIAAAQPLTGAPESAAARMFAGFVELIVGMASRAPLVVVVEDVHWADSASIDVLAFAARKLRHAPVVLILTLRPEIGRPGSQIGAALAEIRRLASTVEVALGPLTGAEVNDLLSALPRPPTSAQRAAITARADGNPFFAVHLARHPTGQAVPPGLQQLLGATLEDVAAADRDLLIQVAVSGDAVELADLATAASDDSTAAGDVAQRVRGLIHCGLLVTSGSQIRFTHALLREVAMSQALPTELATAHHRAADALLQAAAGVPDKAAALAHHLLGAGRISEALPYALTGARWASTVWAFKAACELYATVNRRWTLVPNPESLTGTDRASVLREAAVAYRWAGDFAGAATLVDQAAAIPGLTVAQQIDLAHTRGQICWGIGDLTGALAAYQAATALLDQLPPDSDQVRRATVLAALAQGLMVTGNAQLAVETATAATAVARSVHADAVEIHARITRGSALAQLGALDQAIDTLRSALAAARATDDLELVVRAYGNLTFALGTAGRYDELAAAAEEGLSHCRRYGSVVSLASTMVNNLVSALTKLGRWTAAVEVAERALDDNPAPAVVTYLRLRLADVALARGDLDGCQEQLELSGVIGSGDLYVRSLRVTVVGDAAIAAGRPADALDEVAAVLPMLLAQDDALPVLEACRVGLRAEADLAELSVGTLRTHQSATTPDLLTMADQAADRSPMVAVAALHAECVAEAARASATDTEELWVAARQANLDLGRPYPAAYCDVRLATVQLRRRARAAASVTLRRVVEDAQALGAAGLLNDARRLVELAGLDLTPEPETPKQAGRNPGGLTPRELEVLPLLMKGATNRMIGRTLFISERTASVHVSNILGKLHASNRTEAARLAQRLYLDKHPR